MKLRLIEKVKEKIPWLKKTIEKKSYTDNSMFTDKLVSMYESAKAYKDDKTIEWETYLDYYQGKQWKGIKKLNWKAYVVLNFCYSTIETVVPIITDNKPKISFFAVEPNDMAIASIYDAAIDYIQYINDFDIKLSQVARYMEIFGNGFFYVTWNPLFRGDGDIYIKKIDPRKIIPEPGVENIDDCEYMIYEDEYSIEKLKRMFPDKVDELEELHVLQAGSSFPKNDRDKITSLPTTEENKPEPIKILEFWMKDDTMEKKTVDCCEPELDFMGMPVMKVSQVPMMDEIGDPVLDEFGGQALNEIQEPLMRYWTEVETKKKYPTGRIVVVAYGTKNLLLKDIPNFLPYQYPFVKFVGLDSIESEDTSCFWGESELKNLIPVQDEINKTVSQVIDIRNRSLRTSFKMDKNCGIDPYKITNAPGESYPLNPGTRFDEIPPPPIPQYPFQLTNELKFTYDTISGVHDVTAGRRPTGIGTGIAIAELQEAAQTRIRLKIRNMENSLQRVGEKIRDLIGKFYTEDRIISVVGENAKALQILAEQSYNSPQFNEMGMDTRPVNFLNANQDKSYFKVRGKYMTGKFDVRVEPGSAMPISKVLKAQQAVQQFQIGLIDRLEALKDLGRLNAEEINNRMTPPLPQGIPQQGGVPQGVPQGAPQSPPQGMPDIQSLLGNLMQGGNLEQITSQIPPDILQNLMQLLTQGNQQQ